MGGAAIVLSCLVLTVFLITVSASFSDVSDSTTYSGAIVYAQQNGIVSGYKDGSFHPLSHINRAEFNKITVTAAFNYDPAKDPSGFDLTSVTGLPFQDLQNHVWYNPYFRESYKRKIMSGDGNGLMRPGDDISFVEAAKIIVLSFGYSTGAGANWYQPYVDKLAELKAIPPTITSYSYKINRAEMVEIIQRLKEKITTRTSLDNTLKTVISSNPNPSPQPNPTPTPSVNPTPVVPSPVTPAPVSTGGPMVGTCQIFPSDNPWNRDISKDPLDPNSDKYLQYISGLGGNQSLHPDVGGNGQWGIPYVVVDGNQPKVSIDIWEYPGESDPGPYPLPFTAPKENGGDGHVIAVDKDNCMLYELYQGSYVGPGWKASIAAKFDLKSNALRPEGWTSADAAGLPIFPGLFRYDEVAAGEIKHAIRVTFSKTQRAYIHPATHYASSITDPNAPPMGLRLRLKASYDISGFTGPARVILETMKKYGLMVADNGSNWFFSGGLDPRWNDDELNTLKTVPGSAFEVVQSGTVIKGY